MADVIEISFSKWVNFYEYTIIFSMFINFVVILSTTIIIIINLSREKERIVTPPIVDYTLWAFGFFSNIFISIFGILVSIENIKIHNVFKIEVISSTESNEKQISCFVKFFYVFKDIINNYKKTEMSFKAFKILEKLDKIKIPDDQIKKLESSTSTSKDIELYNTIILFKQLIKNNLLYRVSMGNYLNLITLVFLYFNGVMFFVPYYNQNIIKGTPKKIVEIFMSVLNQIFSLLFSYIAIVCENVNYLSRICDEITEDLNLSLISEKKLIRKIRDYFDNIINPLNTIFKKKSDLEKEQEALDLTTSVTFFGNPK